LAGKNFGGKKFWREKILAGKIFGGKQFWREKSRVEKQIHFLKSSYKMLNFL
jgi:hypothetical protein